MNMWQCWSRRLAMICFLAVPVPSGLCQTVASCPILYGVQSRRLESSIEGVSFCVPEKYQRRESRGRESWIPGEGLRERGPLVEIIRIESLAPPTLTGSPYGYEPGKPLPGCIDCASWSEYKLNANEMGDKIVIIESALLSGTFGHFVDVPVMQGMLRRANGEWILVRMYGAKTDSPSGLLRVLETVTWPE